MPLSWVKRASTASSAFFNEAAAKTVMGASGAGAEKAEALRVEMRQVRTANRVNIQPLLHRAGAGVHGPRVCPGKICGDAAEPEAPFRASDALTARRRVAPAKIAMTVAGSKGLLINLVGWVEPFARPNSGMS